MATIEIPDLPAGLRLRPLDDADIARAAELNAEAGWNQTAVDWRFMLEAGRGTGIEDGTGDGGGRLIATSMALPYRGFAWIAMILVTRKWQRRGLATALMQHAKTLCPAGLHLVTLQGNAAACQFYERHGFVASERGLSPAPESEPDVRYRWAGFQS